MRKQSDKLKFDDKVKIATAWQWIPLLLIYSTKDKKMKEYELFKRYEKLAQIIKKEKFFVTSGSLAFDDIIDWYQKNEFIKVYKPKNPGVRVIELTNFSENAFRHAKELVKEAFDKYYNDNRLRELLNNDFSDFISTIFEKK